MLTAFVMKDLHIKILLIILLFGCGGTTEDPIPDSDPIEIDIQDPIDNSTQFADIDFSNWKVTLPVDENNNGSDQQR